MFEADGVKVSWYAIPFFSNTVGVVYSATTGNVDPSSSRRMQSARKSKRQARTFAEATNGDKYTSRARPTFLYVCNVILAWNYILVPMLGRKPIEFPEPPLWLFGSVMLGYVGARSWEKISAVKAD